MLRALMDKVHSMEEQMNNVSTEMEILRKKQKRNGRDKIHWNKNEKCF